MSKLVLIMVDLNFLLTLFGTLLTLLGIFYTLYYDKNIIKIKSIVPAISGERHNEKEWKHSICSIQVEVRNKGKKDAQKCKGIVTFKKMDSLILHPTENGEISTEANSFSIHAGEGKHLVASWGYSGTAIDGSSGLDKGTFLEKAPPITVVIYCGERIIRKTIKEKDIERILRKHEVDVYKNSI
jgi:hypothetical protein